jgi:hypothetical protein
MIMKLRNQPYAPKMERRGRKKCLFMTLYAEKKIKLGTEEKSSALRRIPKETLGTLQNVCCELHTLSGLIPAILNMRSKPKSLDLLIQRFSKFGTGTSRSAIAANQQYRVLSGMHECSLS